MPVHLFKLRRMIGAGAAAGKAARLGHMPVLRGRIPLPPQRLWISGVTKDSTGAVLAGCSVRLFQTRGDQCVEQLVSDANGAYAFSAVGLSEPYYVVAYKAGAPDVAGTTRNDLIGS